MANANVENIQYTPWKGSQHPTLQLMKDNLQSDGLRPFRTVHQGNYRCGVRSHGYSKSMYCVEGKVELMLPDSRRRVVLRPGDRLDLGAGVRHSITVGIQGAILLEGTPKRLERR